MSEIVLELGLIMALILLNGFFAATEMAVISVRLSHLQALADAGHRRARRVLALRQDPSRFLSTIQIGITLVGTLASAVGGASVIRFLEPQLAVLPLPWPAVYAEVVALLLVVVVISYLSLVLGELVPKELALRRTVALAVTLSGPIDRLSRLMAPLVRALTWSSGLVLRVVMHLSALLFPTRSETEADVADEEVLALLREGVISGYFHPSEQTLVQGIFRFTDRQVQQIMTPRTDIVAVPADMPLAQILDLACRQGYTRYPVYEGNLDHIVGLVHIKDMLPGNNLQQQARDVARNPLLVPGGLQLIEMLQQFQRTGTHMAIVLDEYGGTAGLVTMEDLLEEIVGSIEDEYPHVEPQLKHYSDGTFAVPGMFPIDDLAEVLKVTLPENALYETVAGFIFHSLGHIPQLREEVVYEDYKLIVLETEGRRIRQVLIVPLSDRKEGEAPCQMQKTTSH